MEYPFSRSHWEDPFYPWRNRSAMKIPVQTARTGFPPRIVTIPVRYVGSELCRSEPAVKIQKAVRGFLVRKSVRRILAIKKEVHEIQHLISDIVGINRIRKDSQERLRVNETLMNLLIRLDSVQISDPGVRYLRKSVNKQAIAIQDAVDALILGGGSAETALDENAVTETPIEGREMAESTAVEEKVQGEEADCSDTAYPVDHLAHHGSVSKDMADSQDALPKDETASVCVSAPESDVNEIHDYHAGGRVEAKAEEEKQEEAKSETDSSSDPQEMAEEMEKEEAETATFDNKTTRAEQHKSQALLEKMIEENEKMAGMMKELFEKNESQTRLLTSLSQRVEQLEKAFVYDKLRRKKKKRQV